MKEIKFRVWDREKKRFIHDCAIKQFGDLIRIWVDEWEYAEPPDRYEVSLYVGKKDKNKKEIYTGDIVRLYRPEGEEIGVVEFSDGAFYVSLPLSEDGEEREAVPFFWTEDDIEVIGNVYENPELVEES